MWAAACRTGGSPAAPNALPPSNRPEPRLPLVVAPCLSLFFVRRFQELNVSELELERNPYRCAGSFCAVQIE